MLCLFFIGATMFYMSVFDLNDALLATGSTPFRVMFLSSSDNKNEAFGMKSKPTHGQSGSPTLITLKRRTDPVKARLSLSLRMQMRQVGEVAASCPILPHTHEIDLTPSRLWIRTGAVWGTCITHHRQRHERVRPFFCCVMFTANFCYVHMRTPVLCRVTNQSTVTQEKKPQSRRGNKQTEKKEPEPSVLLLQISNGNTRTVEEPKKKKKPVKLLLAAPRLTGAQSANTVMDLQRRFQWTNRGARLEGTGCTVRLGSDPEAAMCVLIWSRGRRVESCFRWTKGNLVADQQPSHLWGQFLTAVQQPSSGASGSTTLLKPGAQGAAPGKQTLEDLL